MSRLGEQNVPGFSALRQTIEKAHETADVEITTVSKGNFKVKRGDIEFGNGVITIPQGDKLVVMPSTAIDHVSFRKP